MAAEQKPHITQFDPLKHLTKVSGRDYLEVKWRLVWLRQQHPDAVIETELVSHDPQKQFAVFRARVTLPDGGSATGYAHGEPAGKITDYLEKGETKALGRALLALGFGTQHAGFDFADDLDEREDGPVAQSAAQPAPLKLDGAAREQKVSELAQLLGEAPDDEGIKAVWKRVKAAGLEGEQALLDAGKDRRMALAAAAADAA